MLDSGSDEYDADPTQTTQVESQEHVGLREIVRQVNVDLGAGKGKGMVSVR